MVSVYIAYIIYNFICAVLIAAYFLPIYIQAFCLCESSEELYGCRGVFQLIGEREVYADTICSSPRPAIFFIIST